jgi:plasmid stability protein
VGETPTLLDGHCPRQPGCLFSLPEILPKKPLARVGWEHYATAVKSLHIRDVPEPVIARLKPRALLHHRSLQGELIFVLEEAAKQIPHEEPADFSLNTVKTQGTQNWSREGIYED